MKKKPEDKMLEEIGEFLNKWHGVGKIDSPQQILSIIAKYCVILEEGELPEPCKWAAIGAELVLGATEIYKVAQQDMIMFGYRKVREIEK